MTIGIANPSRFSGLQLLSVRGSYLQQSGVRLSPEKKDSHDACSNRREEPPMEIPGSKSPASPLAETTSPKLATAVPADRSRTRPALDSSANTGTTTPRSHRSIQAAKTRPHTAAASTAC